jgi:exopolyphosphatase/guanosine-5'-triphosphate,3'-diphosphate pyrophosphatase
MIKAIIDLGSNTFHLLIAEVNNNEVITYFKKRTFVGLSEGGIDVLKEESIERGLISLQEFKTILNSGYKYDKLIVTGTAALRTASNADVFIRQAQDILNTEITIIDGIKEAELIYNGASILTNMKSGYHLIMDIGGGSTEFIIVKDDKMVWSKSYKLGVGVMHNLFQKTDPINLNDENGLRIFLQNELSDLSDQVSVKHFESLVGASGSFEVLETMTGHEVSTKSNRFISLNSFKEISQRIIKAGYEERLLMKGLPENRVRLIVVAMILIEEVLKIVRPDALQVTPYALKEGILIE